MESEINSIWHLATCTDGTENLKPSKRLTGLEVESRGEPPNTTSKTETIVLTKRRQEKPSLSNRMSTVFLINDSDHQICLPPRQLKKIPPLSWFPTKAAIDTERKM